ncbi:MAG TPA: mechanosensitive ion channel family protein [Gemmatimonadaceae bacterium]|nr:mechanosensitive ion channel family protein [Gemmatimonadaceae bacterium]
MDVRGLLDDLTLPEFFGWILLGNTILNWIVFALTLILVFGGLALAKRIIFGRLAKRVALLPGRPDEFILELLRRTSFFILMFIALSIAIRTLRLSPAAATWASRLGYAALFIQFGLWGTGVIALVSQRFVAARDGTEADTAMTIRAATFLVRVVLWAMILLLTLQNVFAVNITALITGLGIGGIAIALAVQNILSDLFGAVSIVLDKPFVVGDFIIVGDFLGTVEYVGLKTTRLRSLSGEQIIFSNSDLLNSRIRNYKRMFERRAVFAIGVTYGTPPEKLAAIGGWIRTIVETQPEARFDRAHFKTFGASSLDYEVVYYVKKPDFNTYMDTQQAINIALVRKFAAEGIEFAFPTRTVHVSGMLESAPPPPALQP